MSRVSRVACLPLGLSVPQLCMELRMGIAVTVTDRHPAQVLRRKNIPEKPLFSKTYLKIMMRMRSLFHPLHKPEQCHPFFVCQVARSMTGPARRSS